MPKPCFLTRFVRECCTHSCTAERIITNSSASHMEQARQCARRPRPYTPLRQHAQSADHPLLMYHQLSAWRCRRVVLYTAFVIVHQVRGPSSTLLDARHHISRKPCNAELQRAALRLLGEAGRRQGWEKAVHPAKMELKSWSDHLIAAIAHASPVEGPQLGFAPACRVHVMCGSVWHRVEMCSPCTCLLDGRER